LNKHHFQHTSAKMTMMMMLLSGASRSTARRSFATPSRILLQRHSVRWMASAAKDTAGSGKKPSAQQPSPSNKPPSPYGYHIPGMQQFGSLHDAGARRSVADRGGHQDVTAWQAAENVDVQNVTRKAMIYELIHQQTETIENVVPWFLENMPASYFRQVPERFRMDHIKAIAAVKDANMDLYLNLQAHLPDGRQVLTFIRPGTTAGTLLQMVSELPEKYST
jgi:hypothetical protein